MEVSVAVCVYNEEKNIHEFLHSLSQQTFRDFELIIVDDGSSDGTVQVIETFHEELHITLIPLEHSGLRRARQHAVSNSSGNIIITLDADEIIDRYCIEYLLKPFTDADVWAVGGQIKAYDDGLLSLAYGCIHDLSFNSRRKGSTWLSGGCAAYRKEALEKTGNLSTENIGEDVDASWAIQSFGKKVVLCEEAICYHKHPVTVSSVLRREYDIGKRAVLLFSKHKKYRKDFTFLYRFTSLPAVLIFPVLPSISLSYFIITGILFFCKCKNFPYGKIIQLISFGLLNLSNIVWSVAYARHCCRKKSSLSTLW
jgi:cellulose synthase/poly-beta-1,6-N-acetylglucosamine synthase-like glycosyltransferase